jgi:hypothetical protein
MSDETIEKVMTPQEGWVGGNAYTHFCDPVSHFRHYAVCANLVKAYREGRLEAENIYGDCANEMRKGGCRAVTMVDEELAVGKAIYFKERKKFEHIINASSKVDENSESYIRGWNQAGSNPKLDRATPGVSHAPVAKPGRRHIPAPKKEESFMQMDMAQIVTDIATAESEAKKTGKPVVTAAQGGVKRGETHIVTAKNNVGRTQLPQLKPLPGESMIEFAKRLKAAREAAA